MNTWGKVVGGASITAGVVAAAALGGVTAQRRAVRRFRAAGSDPVQAYGALASDRSYSVVADDGVVLHVEEVGPENAPLTVIFAHGWLLRAGSWHFQRIGLAGKGFGTGSGPAARLVFYDQRSHGKSSRAEGTGVAMTDLAADLATVMATAAPQGPVVLIGHSMGGMALISLAGLQPELIADRVVGVGLVSTSASQLVIPGIGRSLLRFDNPLLRLATGTAARFPQLLERGRRGSRDAVWLLTRALGFARRDVPGDLVDYLDEMISDTPIDVIAEFTPTLMGLSAQDALPALSEIPTVIICGDADRMTPAARSKFIADSLPRAELVIIPGAGHMATMEAPEEVNQALRGMLQQAAERAGLTGPPQAPLMTLVLPTAADTDDLGRRLGAVLRAGDVIVLVGNLGAGKTALAQGIGAGLGVRGQVASPTFVIARVHPPGRPGAPGLVHVDAYRLTGALELDDLDLDTDLARSAVVVEWGEGLAERLADSHLRIELVRQPDDSRTATLVPTGGDWSERVAALLA